MAVPSLYDHVQRGLERLPTYYDDKPKALGVIETLLSELNRIESAADQLRNNTTIQNGVGYTLDVIGALFNIKRMGRDDETYRQAILREGVLYFSDGTVNAIIEATNVFTGRQDCIHVDYLNGLHFVQVKGGELDGITPFLNNNVAAAGTKLKVSLDLGQTIATSTLPPPTVLVDQDGNNIQVNQNSNSFNLEVVTNQQQQTTTTIPILWVLE